MTALTLLRFILLILGGFSGPRLGVTQVQSVQALPTWQPLPQRPRRPPLPVRRGEPKVPRVSAEHKRIKQWGVWDAHAHPSALTRCWHQTHSLNTRSLAPPPRTLGWSVQVGDVPALGPAGLTAVVTCRHIYNGQEPGAP